MGVKVWVVALAVAAVALAGCAQESQVQQDADEEETFQEFDLKADKDTGVIRGIVVTSAIVPIAGVNVTLQGQDKATVTNEQGAFGFSGLAPGTYFLVAEKAGFITIQQSASVTAGDDKPPILKILLEADPAAQPYSELVQFNGFIACSFTLVLVSFAACGLTGVSSVTGNDFIRNVVYERVPAFVQSEMVWDSTQAFGDSMSMSWTDPRGGQRGINGSAGPSPQMTNFDRERFEEMELLDANIWLRVFSTSREGSDVINEETWNAPWRQTVYPTLNSTPVVGVVGTVVGASGGLLLNPLGEDCVRWFILFQSCLGAGGVGMTLQQPFEIFTTNFYGYTPPEGWWFLEDGDAPPPGR